MNITQSTLDQFFTIWVILVFGMFAIFLFLALIGLSFAVLATIKSFFKKNKKS